MSKELTKEKLKIKAQLDELIDQYFAIENKQPLTNTLPLVVPSYDATEVKEALDSLLSTYVTMGTKCRKFEQLFAKYVGVKDGLFVNSGSSANLIALSILSSPVIDDPIKPGNEIITPAVTWSTTVFPMYDIGAIPVFVDADINTMTMDVRQIEKAITPKTKAIMPVHLLGNPCDMKAIMEIAAENNLYVIEDCCEAHGGKIGSKMLGSFGHLSTFSFFFSHHISTIEGGIVLANDENYLNIGRSLRAHGWTRERSDKKSIENIHKGMDSRFLFVHRGYNLRPTEIQGAFGIHQITKLEDFVAKREHAAFYLQKNLQKYSKYLILPSIMSNCRQSWFGFSIIVKDGAPFTRNELAEYLEKNKIETRPIMGGNMVQQPVMAHLTYNTVNKLPNSTKIFTDGIFIGLHHKMTEENLCRVIKIFDDFFTTITSS